MRKHPVKKFFNSVNRLIGFIIIIAVIVLLFWLIYVGLMKHFDYY